MGNRQIALGGAIATLGAVSLAAGAVAMGTPILVFGGLLSGLGVLVRLSGGAVPVVNTSYNLLLQGRLGEAERLLDEAEGRYQLAYIRRVIDLQRASIALRRGDLQGALTRAETALARPSGVLTRGQDRHHTTAARALRALIRASLGDVEGARADAAAVRALPDAPAEALARAEVAEAIALERAGDREALAAHLRGKRRILLDQTNPRERAVIRALQRLLRAPRTGVYRTGAAREEEPPEAGEPTVADWVARVAPSAAPFARASARAGEAAPARAPEEAAEPGLVRVAEARLSSSAARRPVRARGKLVALWLVLVALFVAIWQFLESLPGTAAQGAAGAQLVEDALPATVGVLVMAIMAAVGLLIVRNLGQDRRLAEALGALARDDAGAPAQLEALTRSPYAAVTAQAHLALARVAQRRGDLEEALARCDQGIAAATARESTRAMVSSILLPDLCAERAFVLAASGRDDKARAELAALRRQFPAYPFLARAEVRVELVRCARRGDLQAAARVVAAAGEDLPLSQREETLADLVRALAQPEGVGAFEVERLREELRVDGELRGWIHAVAPEVLRKFESPAAQPPEPGEAEAEEEALAVEEEVRAARRASR